MSNWLNGSIHPQLRTIDGLSIRLAEECEPGRSRALAEPWPESVFAFEPTWARLTRHQLVERWLLDRGIRRGALIELNQRATDGREESADEDHGGR